MVVKALEKKIIKLLPNKFPLIFDGWTLDGASTHYVAVYARMFNSLNGMKKIEGRLRKKLQISLKKLTFIRSC